jgi:hypothetical protein
MKARCIQAVSQAIGRDLKVAEARNLEQRIKDAMRREAGKDPAAWQALSVGDRLRLGAQAAGKEIVEEASLKKTRVARQIEAWDRMDTYTHEQVAKGFDDDRLSALERTLAPVNDGKNNVVSIESAANGIEATAMGRLVEAWDSVSPRFMGLFSRKDAEDAFVLEAHGIDSGNAEVKAGAKAWADTVESLRQRFNAAGGNIGRLVNWGMPHSWSQQLTTKLGQDAFITDFMQWVDRRVYVHEDGRAYTDDEMRAFLGEAWRTISTDGASKLKPEPMPGGAVKANRGGQHRQIHFKDGRTALEAFRKYSDRNLFEVLSGHVRAMSRDIAIIEQWGPNADFAFETMLRQAYQEAAQPGAVAGANEKVARLERLYDHLSGNGAPPLDNWLARGMADLRAILSSALLGSAAITSLSDNGTLYLTARVNKLPALQVFFNALRGYNPANRTEARLAARAGLMVKSMQNDVARFSADTMGPRWSSRMSAFFMRASGLNAITEVRRRAFSATMMDAIGALTRNVADVTKLDADDYRFLASKGIDQQTWDIWRATKPETWGGNHTVLTPEAIYRAQGPWSQIDRDRAASRLLSVVLEEQNIAVIEPGARERAWLGATQAGTFQGELMRSVFLFKSFPHAMLKRHIERGLKAYDGATGKVGYLASLLALQTLFGAIAMETNDLVSGRDPRNLNPFEKHGARNLLSALLKGGALGIYGDFIFNEASANGRSMVETMAGPVASAVAGIDAATRGNLIQFMRGDETNAGAELTRVARGLIPGANLWYAKAALDHLIFQELQENFSPGYLARMRSKAQREYGTTYWWAPGQDIDRARAPNLGNIVGASK